MGSFPTRKPQRRTALALVVTLAGGHISLPSASAQSREAQPEFVSHPVDEYIADFTDAPSRGIGLRYEHQPSGHYVDLRLEGYRGSAGQMQGRGATFSADEHVRVLYEVVPFSVKETIVVDQLGPTTFRFRVNAPEMVVTLREGRIVFSSSTHPSLFQLLPPKAWDALGTDIPAQLTLDSDRVVLALDPGVLASATPPIFIDPTIQGAPVASIPPHVRRLFRTADSRILFFDVEDIGGSKKAVYRLSTNDGATWSAPVQLAATSASSGLAVTALPNDGFGIMYTIGTTGAEQAAFRELTRGGDSWSAGTERLVATGAGAISNPQVAFRGTGSLGVRLAAGFWRWNSLLSLSEFVTVMSEDTGLTWTGLSVCGTSSWANTIAIRSGAPICTTTSAGGMLEWRSWDGLSWTPSQSLIPVKNGDAAPSWVETTDGVLHVAVSGQEADGSRGVFYSRLYAGTGSWTPMNKLSAGTVPVISTDGTGLRVHAQDTLSAVESVIRRFASPDGEQWTTLQQMDGGEFQYVLDYTSNWAFSTYPGDILFNTQHSGGAVGNLIGTGNFVHKLDSEDKRLAFSFDAPRNGSITQIKLWTTSVNPPTYRIGVQTDAAGLPSGHWLDEVLVGGIPVSGAFRDTTIPTGLVNGPIQVDLPQTGVQDGVRYHLVIEPKHDPSPLGTNADASHWAGFQTVGADTQGTSLEVLDRAGASPWAPASNQVPRFTLKESAQTTLLAQELASSGWLMANEYSLPAESFLNPITRSLTSISVFIKKVGNPTEAITLRLLDTAGNEVWAQQLGLQSEGWVSISPVAANLIGNQSYRLVLDSHAAGLWDFWLVAVSNGDGTSWDGNSSTAVRAFDRPGFSDRSPQAGETQQVLPDLVAFNNSTTDELYVGSGEPFHTVAATRLYTDSWGSPSLSASYWNGSAWASLSLTNNSLGNFPAGRLSFTPPSDWSSTSVNGKVSYWLRFTQASGPTALHIDRMTSYHSYSSPSSAPTSSTSVPLVYLRSDGTNGIVYQADSGPFQQVVPGLSAHLEVTWCLLANPKSSPTGSTFVVGDIFGRDDEHCDNGFDPVSLLVPLGPPEKRNLYSRMEATRGTSDRYFQLSKVICTNETAGILASTNNLEGTSVQHTIARNLIIGGTGSTTVNCSLRARSVNLFSESTSTYLSIVPSTLLAGHTYVLAETDDKVGADRWQQSGDFYVPSGTTTTVLRRTWPASTAAVGARILVDLELTTCWGFCATVPDALEGELGSNSRVEVTAWSRPTSSGNPGGLCQPASAVRPDTITTEEHHLKINMTLQPLTEDLPPQCTGLQMNIEVAIRVISGNPVEYTNGGSVAIAMNDVP